MRRKDIQGYEGLYYVTDTGEVWSYDREYIIPIHNIKKVRKSRKLKTRIHNGYEWLTLCKNGKTKVFSMHRIVAINFLENSKLKKQVNHKDGKKHNNNVCNLEWSTPSENSMHAYKMGLNNPPVLKGQDHAKAKLTDKDVLKIRKMLAEGVFQKEIASIYKIKQTTVSNINVRKSWKHI